MKLEYFDLWRYFRAARSETMRRIGMDCCRKRWRASARAAGRTVAASDVVVVGDTPLDVACAAASGARSIAVATGGYDVEALRAAGADVVFEDLSDLDAVLSAI